MHQQERRSMATRTTITPTTLVRSINEEHTLTVGGVTLTIPMGNADTAVLCVLLRVTVPPYWDACVAHRHAHTTEVICVVNGTLACTLDDTTTTASGGTAMLISPGVVHTIWNPTATPATYLVWFSPSGGERYGEAFASRAASEPAQPPAPRFMPATLSATSDVLLAHPDGGDGLHPD
jgi:quercetin dioxygenase-like cupin family protein